MAPQTPVALLCPTDPPGLQAPSTPVEAVQAAAAAAAAAAAPTADLVAYARAKPKPPVHAPPSRLLVRPPGMPMFMPFDPNAAAETNAAYAAHATVAEQAAAAASLAAILQPAATEASPDAPPAAPPAAQEAAPETTGGPATEPAPPPPADADC